MFNILLHYPRVLARHRQGRAIPHPSRRSKGPPAIPCYAQPVNFWSSPSASTSRPIG